jgi:uncharacterized protein YjbI with pentapeptide repeats
MNRLAGPSGAGPRPRHSLSWWPQIRRRRGLGWWFDHSFSLRLLLSLFLAAGLLGLVDRWQNCRSLRFAHGCLHSDPGAIVTISNIESLSIVAAAFLYLLEGTQRRQRENLAAMDVILSCQQAHARLSHARNDALEMLSSRGVWLDGLDLSGAHLDDLRADHGRWRGVQLQGASLRRASFQDADLQGADLRGADLAAASLEHADLRQARLEDCDLRDVNLRGADLRGARLAGARLDGSRLDGAEWSDSDQEHTATADASRDD